MGSSLLFFAAAVSTVAVHVTSANLLAQDIALILAHLLCLLSSPFHVFDIFGRLR
jgi:hypothetical protein